MRRIVLVSIVAAVVGGLGVGTWWYLRQRGGPAPSRLLAQAKLAVKASQFAKALDLAGRYIVIHPEDWRGYFIQATAYNRLGRYAEAREPLAKAAELNPAEIAVPLALANTYAFPARQLLAASGASEQIPRLREAVELLGEVDEVLSGVQAAEEPDKLEIDQYLGLNQMHLASAQLTMGRKLQEQAETAAAARAVELEEAKRKESRAALAAAERARRRATQTLLDVVLRDASRARAARGLINLCVENDDRAALDKARGAIMALDRPPSVPAAMIAMYDLRSSLQADIDADRGQREIAETCRVVDRLLKQDPDRVEVKLARAELALMALDYETAERLCQEILKRDPRQRQARLLLSGSLLRRNDVARAERELFMLITDFPPWADAHFAYARATMRSGKKELAREAMRKVTQLQPGHAEACKYLAETLLEDGFCEQAFVDAQAYHKAHPDQPAAIDLFVESARRTNRIELARSALRQTASGCGDRAEVLMAVSEGCARLGDADQAAALAGKVAGMTPSTTAETFAVARANAAIGKTAAAVAMLKAAIARRPKSAAAHFELARVCSQAGRSVVALSHCRQAVRLDGENLAYRLALAREFFDIGLLDECQGQCREILKREPHHHGASLLISQVRIISGDGISPAEVLEQARSNRQAGLALAAAYLSGDQPRKCLELCRAELDRAPDNLDARLLLGQAHVLLGESDQAVQQWRMLLSSAPDRLPVYLGIAALLGRASPPASVEAALTSIPGARRDMADLAMGWLFERSGEYASAAETYGRLLGRKATPEDMRGRVRILRARCMGRAGRVEEAIAELQEPRLSQAWRPRAALAKADLLIDSGRAAEAEQVLSELSETSSARADQETLERVVSLYVRMGRHEKALAACDKLAEMLPNEAGPCHLRADVLVAAGRGQDAIKWCREAIRRQPADFAAHLMLVEALDAELQPAEALHVLERMASAGPVGRSLALFHRARLLGRWGLRTTAAESLDRLVEADGGHNPRLQVALARVFMDLGCRQRARELLAGTPEHARRSWPARLLAAELAETTEEKLRVLRSVPRPGRGGEEAVAGEMAVLLPAGQGGEALRAYQAFADDHPGRAGASPRLTFLRLKAMVSMDHPGAVQASLLAARRLRRGPCRQIAALLLADRSADEAGRAALAEVLAPAGEADLHDAAIGLAAACAAGGEETDKWCRLVLEISQRPGSTGGPDPAPAAYSLLAAVAGGRAAHARTLLATCPLAGGIDSDVVAEFVAGAENDADRAAEAAELLKASVALDLQLPALASRRAMGALKSRPTCQWAALLAVQCQDGPAARREVLALLRPEDCPLALRLRAELLEHQRQYDKAAETYRLAAASSNDPALLCRQAVAMERAGSAAEALTLYRRILKARPGPVAANNAACILSQLSPKDPVSLSEAAALAAAAVQAAPDAPAFRDTKGWIACLRGRHADALGDLRRAVRGLPDSPDVHYHVGVAEAAAGSKDLARWHFAEAGSIGSRLSAAGGPVSASSTKAIALARAALADLRAPQP